jgi:hypothetical protein
MFGTLIFAAAGFTTVMPQVSCEGALITQTNVSALVKTLDAGIPETQKLHGEVKIAKGVTLKYSFAITSKGNGSIEFPEIGIRIYDSHDDDITFKPYLLCVQLKDMNGDGYKDLVMSGVAEHWDDKIDGKLLSSNQINAIFLYDPKKNTFVAKNVSDEIGYWYNNTYCDGMNCKIE